MEGVQFVGDDGARSIQLNLIDMRQRPTVIPLVAVAFCGVLAGCDSPTAPGRARKGYDDERGRGARRAHLVPASAPEVLIDVLARLSDPAVPGADKIDLVELATADDAAALDKFGKALADSGALPLTFAATDLKWSETETGNVVATVDVTTANKPPGKFSFPMEFTPVRDQWELTRKTADLLLDFGNAQTATSPPP